MKKFNLIYQVEGSNEPKSELVDYSGDNLNRLKGEKSWFANWCAGRNINVLALDEEQCGYQLINFFNSTLRPYERRRIFLNVQVLD